MPDNKPEDLIKYLKESKNDLENIAKKSKTASIDNNLSKNPEALFNKLNATEFYNNLTPPIAAPIVTTTSTETTKKDN